MDRHITIGESMDIWQRVEKAIDLKIPCPRCSLNPEIEKAEPMTQLEVFSNWDWEAWAICKTCGTDLKLELNFKEQPYVWQMGDKKDGNS